MVWQEGRKAGRQQKAEKKEREREREGERDGKEILVMMMPLLFHLLNDRFLSSPSDVLSPRLRASLMHSTPLLCIRLACVKLYRRKREKEQNKGAIDLFFSSSFSF